MEPLKPDTSRKGEVITIPAGLDPSAIRTKVLEKVKEKVEGIKLEDATVVIAGGRGVGGVEGFRQLEELAKLLKGAVGASRPACDNGWIPNAAQIGLTGKIVTPDLYIAVGISGASQHLAGCSSAKAIVAINKDPEANIFRQAQYGVVEDWKKVLPAFIQKVKELLAG
jgi:electron transfer flavoprotein alpha subunit